MTARLSLQKADPSRGGVEMGKEILGWIVLSRPIGPHGIGA